MSNGGCGGGGGGGGCGCGGGGGGGDANMLIIGGWLRLVLQFLIVKTIFPWGVQISCQ
jgi:hypothetical protein